MRAETRASTWASHIRRSETPAWMSRTTGPEPATLWCNVVVMRAAWQPQDGHAPVFHLAHMPPSHRAVVATCHVIIVWREEQVPIHHDGLRRRSPGLRHDDDINKPRVSALPNGRPDAATPALLLART